MRWKLFNRLRRLARYLPILWKGGDWDFAYALELFQYKLEDIAQYYKDHPDHHVGQEKEHRRLLIMLEHLRQFTADGDKPQPLYDRLGKPTCGMDDIDEWLHELNNNNHMHIFLDENAKLKEYHWEEFCKYVKKHLRSIWV